MNDSDRTSDKVERHARDWANRNLYSMNRHELAREAFRAGYEQCVQDDGRRVGGNDDD